MVLEGNVDMNKVYSVCFLLLIVVFCSVLFAFEKDTLGKEDTFYHQMNAFNDLVEKNKMTMTDWQVRIKNQSEHVDNFYTQLDQFEKEYPEFERASLEENKNYVHVTFINGDYEETLLEKVKWIVSSTTKGYKIEKTYELLSNGNGELKNQQLFKDRLSTLGFDLQSSMLFYEVKAELDDTPQDLMIEAEHFVSQLGATTLEGLEEKTFVSISAYHKGWTNGIATNDDKEMNVQIALRENQELGSRTTVTFGTPIITTEY